MKAAFWFLKPEKTSHVLSLYHPRRRPPPSRRFHTLLKPPGRRSCRSPPGEGLRGGGAGLENACWRRSRTSARSLRSPARSRRRSGAAAAGGRTSGLPLCLCPPAPVLRARPAHSSCAPVLRAPAASSLAPSPERGVVAGSCAAEHTEVSCGYF